ncbi:MAG TPA: aldehyde dehydrogenase family protein [Planctomycetota bacterium]|nr:aldehyde dehydrogenase family protein [Planctomycetota bacterium]
MSRAVVSPSKRILPKLDPLAPNLNFIAGQWAPAAGGETFESRSPSNKEELIGHFPRSREVDVNNAVTAAAEAFKSWRLVPAPQRGNLLRRCGEILRERKEAIALLMSREMGKPLVEARGDVQEAIDCANLYAGLGRRLAGETVPSELPDKFAMTVRRPVGVCGLITPWNFPVAIPSWKIFPAILCGNTVVLKPAEDSPACGAAFVKALQDAGVPDGVVNLVQGVGEEAGAALVAHPNVALISFTGSSEVGAHIASVCGATHKRCALEMGGKNAQIVMDDADVELALEGAVWGAFATAGQRCTATSRLLLHKKIYKPFLARLVKAAQDVRVGDPLDPNMQIGPLVNEKQRARVQEYIRIGIDEGATLLCGGKPISDAPHSRGWYFEPTVFSAVKPEMRIAQEEIFGPVLSVIKIEDFDEAVAILNNTKYGLSSSVYTKNIDRAFRAMRDFDAGITYINGPTIGAEVHLPFGGIKQTGNGHREAGETVLDIFTEWKSVYVDYSGKLQRAQIDVTAG